MKDIKHNVIILRDMIKATVHLESALQLGSAINT
jgi:hypothetical protein